MAALLNRRVPSVPRRARNLLTSARHVVGLSYDNNNNNIIITTIFRVYGAERRNNARRTARRLAHGPQLHVVGVYLYVPAIKHAVVVVTERVPHARVT